MSIHRSAGRRHKKVKQAARKRLLTRIKHVHKQRVVLEKENKHTGEYDALIESLRIEEQNLRTRL